MMMPANFSAVSENEMTYVVGGGLVDCLAPVMTDANWQTVSKNVVTIIGNTYVQKLVQATLGKVFTGTYQPGDVSTGIWGSITGTYNRNQVDGATGFNAFLNGAKGVLNVGLSVVGGLAAIYNLGNASVKNAVGEKAYTVNF